MNPWTPQNDPQRLLENACKAIMYEEEKNPHETLVFMDPFNWEGELGTPAGVHAAHEVLNHRPAWTAPRVLRLAHAVINEVDKMGMLK